MSGKPYSQLRDELDRIMPKRFFILYTYNNSPRIFVGTSESITGRHGYIVICDTNSFVIEKCHKYHQTLKEYLIDEYNDITQSITIALDYVTNNIIKDFKYPKEIEYKPLTPLL